MKGKVIRSTGSWYDIQGENGKKYPARLRGKFKKNDLKVTNPIAVGDWVDFEEKEPDNFIITDIEPRENYIIRKSTHKSAFGHLIASNLDQAVLVVTLSMPKTSTGFIDRFLISAESFRIPALLVFNKDDLLAEEEKALREELMQIYQKLGYPTILTSAKTGAGIEELKKTLLEKVSLLSGHSGVGKSSLINLLVPGLELATGSISTFSGKGIHTTTFAEMFSMDENTFIIDTPGIKELGMIDMDKEEISHYFPEMRDLLGSCRFHNCVHINEPGCAVKKQVEEGDIAISRYLNYLGMVEEEDSHR